MNIKLSKKEKAIIYIYLLLILLIGTGITFAYLSLADSAPEDSSRVYAGKLDINYIQGNEVSVDVLYPISEPNFNTIRNVYRNKFIVSSDGTLEQNVEICFKVKFNEFAKDEIRYAIYSETGNKLGTGYLNDGLVVLANNIYFKPVETKSFVLILWLENKPYEQIQEQGYKFSGDIIINSKQYGF